MPTTIPAADLYTADYPEPRWLIDGAVSEGLAVLTGPPRIGKSWITLTLAVAMAHGGAALGDFDCNGVIHPVLYLALDDHPRRLQQRLRAMTDTAPAALTFAVNWPRGLDGVQALADYLADHAGTRLVVIDTWQRFFPNQGRGARARMTEVVQALRDLAHAHQLTILCLTRARRTPELALEPLVTAADTLLQITPHPEIAAVLHITSRDLPEEYHLALVRDEHGWQLAGDADSYTISEQRRAILEVLRYCDEEGLRPHEITLRLGYPPHYGYRVRQLLACLEAEDDVRRVGYGTYRLTTHILDPQTWRDDNPFDDDDDYEDEYSDFKNPTTPSTLPTPPTPLPNSKLKTQNLKLPQNSADPSTVPTPSTVAPPKSEFYIHQEKDERRIDRKNTSKKKISFIRG